MILYPDVAKKAQAELDAVVGQDRLPNFADRERLPYINALLLEVIRWHSVTPTGNLLAPMILYVWLKDGITSYPPSCDGGQHLWRLFDTQRRFSNSQRLVKYFRLTKKINKCLTFNSRFMTHDPKVYPEPSKFSPERFLGPQPQQDPRNISFGFGRRYDCVLSNSLLAMLITNYHIGFVLVSPVT